MSQPDPPASTPQEETLAHKAASTGGHDLSGRVVGDFRVERLLGRGGMGEVYLATQVSLNRPVALKVLRRELATNPTYLGRFEVEATAVARLNHPNIVQVYMLGVVDDLRFIAMEYVPGTTLRDYLARKGTVELTQALTIMRQAGLAVAAAGEIGLIHRDIKPENLLLPKKGQVKVADFGLCREQGSDALHLTQEGMTLGTPMYMSPEQVQGRSLDHRSDLYSLGVTYYHLLAGQPPFRAESAVALALKHVQEAPISLAMRRPDLPPDLVALVMKLLEKKPGRRYQTAQEMLRDLSKIIKEAFAEGASPPVLAPAGAETLALTTPPAPAPDAGRKKRGRDVDRDREPTRSPRSPGRPLGERLAGLELGGRALAALGVLGLIVGFALGWSARTPDLLAADAPSPPGPPALWMDPAWSSIPRQAGARDQLRYAQLIAPESAREAAWLAVPGHFPSDRDAAFKAYTHLARRSLCRGEPGRLEALADSLERAEAQEMERRLSEIARAGAAALHGDAPTAKDRLAAVSRDLTILEPPLAEFALEVVEIARRSPSGSEAQAVPLANLRKALLDALLVGP